MCRKLTQTDFVYIDYKRKETQDNVAIYIFELFLQRCF